MELTFIGMIQAAIGMAIVLGGSVRGAYVFLLISALFDGSAAIALPALGGSSIPPVQFALLFTTLRIIAPRGGYLAFLPEAIRANKWIVFFAIYGMVSAYLAPRLFAGAMGVFPMRPDPSMGPFDTVPLEPSSQNVTGAFYMAGALLLAISSYILCRIPRGGQALVIAVLAGAWLHIVAGVIDLVTRGTPAEIILSAFRNGGYTPLDLSVSGFIRIRGVLPEASSYAGIGFALMLVTAELWFRSIRPRATGIAAAMLAMLLVISTASTAYVALAAYVAFFALRSILLPIYAPPGKIVRALALAFAMVCAICILMALVPRLPQGIYELIAQMTVDKSSSDSGQQRLFWAMQGWDAFFASYGLGIGPGSFRSSSMLTAIMGSMGAVGIVTFVMYLKSVFLFARRSTWGIGNDDAQSIGGACATAALIGLVPAAVASPHAVPMALFSIFAGAAIALRRINQPSPELDSGVAERRPFHWPPLPAHVGVSPL